MGADIENSAALRSLHALGREIRASLASILATTDALRRAEDGQLVAPDRLPSLDAIWRDASRVLDIINGVLASPLCAKELEEKQAGASILGAETIDALEAAAGGKGNLNPKPPVTSVVAASTDDFNTPAGVIRSGTAYLEWLRSRLTQIEQLAREDATAEIADLAGHLKDSAAARGYPEVAEAAAALHRLSGTAGSPIDAGVEILRRVVHHAIRRTGGKAA